MSAYDAVLFYSTFTLSICLALTLFALLHVTGRGRSWGRNDTLFMALFFLGTTIFYSFLAARITLSLDYTLWLSLIIVFCLNLFLISLIRNNQVIKRDAVILLLLLLPPVIALLGDHYSMPTRIWITGLSQAAACVYTLITLARQWKQKGQIYRVMVGCYGLFVACGAYDAIYYLKPWLPYRRLMVYFFPLLVVILVCCLLEYMQSNKEELAAAEHGFSLLEDAGSLDDVVISLARTIDAMDKYTEGHIERVAQYAVFLGERLGLSGEDLETLRIGALIHDIGKIGIDLNILNKPGRLTEEEFEQIKKHPVVGAEICSPMKALAKTAQIVRSHHEKLDGSGYPDGLKGDEIPLMARIVAIADIFDALTTDRPYRPAYSIAKAIHILRQDAAAGKLDARLVEEFVALINDTMVCD